MKKFLLALGAVAVGFSAQAADIQSEATYAIINIPIVGNGGTEGAGQNLVGVSVSPLGNGSIADLLSIASTDSVKKFNGTSYGRVDASAAATAGDILLVDNMQADATLYEVGTSTASGTVSVPIGTIVVLAAPQGFDVVNTTLAANSGSATVRSKCTTVSLWDAEDGAWVKYWYKGGSNGGWRTWGGVAVNSIPVGAGQPFVVQKATTYTGSSFNVTL